MGDTHCNELNLDTMNTQIDKKMNRIILSTNKRYLQMKRSRKEYQIHGIVDIYLHTKYIHKWKFKLNNFYYKLSIGIGSSVDWEHRITLSSFGRMRGCYLNSGFIKGDVVEMVLDLYSVENY